MVPFLGWGLAAFIFYISLCFVIFTISNLIFNLFNTKKFGFSDPAFLELFMIEDLYRKVKPS
jgi:hypothetical protein